MSEWWLANILNGSCRAAVPLFVMISGAMMRERDCDPATFYRKKALRFLPVILIWSALYWVFDMVVLGLSFSQVAIQLVSKGYVYLHLWYLGMFAFLLVFAPFLGRFKFSLPWRANDIRMLVMVSVGFIFIDWSLLFICHVAKVPFNHWTMTFFLFIPYFLLGAWLGKAQNNPKRSFHACMLALALLASWIANFLTCRYLGVVSDTVPLGNHSPLVFAVAVAAFLTAIPMKGDSVQASRLISILGATSLGVYLIHPIFLWLPRRLLRGSTIDMFSGWWMPVTAIVVYAVSLAVIVLIRRFTLGRRIC